ncbi:hypothetical protein CDL12_14443 [Handroanthus impetiginosus]|uniref:Uncharacterized protein n=1 Tax=Handroanthus impetiginosus TaxID=429701 RepID=A0A2G9H5Z4_9LAMI|nr:hypothetical protein CDL12_14443 [Handroanthus impetiginosus]
MVIPGSSIALLMTLLSIVSLEVSGIEANHVYMPCGEALVQRSDGFAFGIVFAARTPFFFGNSVQLSH